MTQDTADIERPTRTSSRTRGRPRLEEVGDIENGLLDAALAEFVAHGYGGASTNRIVRAAKVSKTTFYSRFASKEALFRAIMQRQMDRMAQAEALAPKDGHLDLAEGLKAFGRRSLEVSFEDGLIEVNRLIASESHRFPELAMAAHERREVGIGQLADFIARCALADGIPCHKPRLIAEMFLLMLGGRYVDMVATGGAAMSRGLEHWIGAAVDRLVAGRSGW